MSAPSEKRDGVTGDNPRGDADVPVVVRDADGTLTVQFPENHPTQVYPVAESVIVLWVDYVNEARRELAQLQEAARAVVAAFSSGTMTTVNGRAAWDAVAALRAVLDSAVHSEQAPQ